MRQPSRTNPGGRRIVLTTIGSLGDLNPYLAIAIGLKARGHDAVVATGECHRRRVEAAEVGFHALRPDSDFTTDPARMRRFMDYRWGTIRILREVVVPAIRETYRDVLAAAEGADLLVSHPLTFATRLAAERTGVPWVSTLITPLCLGSAHDPSAIPIVPELSGLRPLGPAFWSPLRRTLARATRIWARPIDGLRSELGLPRSRDNPLVDGHSPRLVLALFSRLLADAQPDWPPQVVHTGFPIHDRDGGTEPPADLARFLDDGPPPLVFTLGATAAMVAGPFFENAALAAARLGRRAVLVVGSGRLPPREALPAGVAAFAYAPFSDLFPRAAAIVHAGGVGVSGLAMRAGRPMLVAPFAHDQPDNADRLRRMGVARTVPGRRCSTRRLVAELGRLLETPSYARRAAEVGERVRLEDGVRTACDALESRLEAGPGGSSDGSS